MMRVGARCFGRLQLAGFELSAECGPPRLSHVPFEVASELKQHAETQGGREELADFLGLQTRACTSEVVERVVRELEWGHLVCTPRRFYGAASSSAVIELEMTALSELSDLEPAGVEYTVELQLVDQDDAPVGGVAYRLTLPDRSIREGILDDRGAARVRGLTSADPCEVCFPTLDAQSWSYVHATPL